MWLIGTIFYRDDLDEYSRRSAFLPDLRVRRFPAAPPGRATACVDCSFIRLENATHTAAVPVGIDRPVVDAPLLPFERPSGGSGGIGYFRHCDGIGCVTVDSMFARWVSVLIPEWREPSHWPNSRRPRRSLAESISSASSFSPCPTPTRRRHRPAAGRRLLDTIPLGGIVVNVSPHTPIGYLPLRCGERSASWAPGHCSG